jgi:hypothetical protein
MENDSSGATQKPMHFRNREKYFLSLKRNISLTEKKSDVREWLKKEYEKTGSLEESPEDIYFIQDCYRLYQAIRSEN